MTPIRRIVRAAAEAFGRRAEDILSPSTRRRDVRPRQAAYLVAREAGASWARIGRAMGRDPKTALSGAAAAQAEAAANEWFRERVEAMRQVLGREGVA